MMKKVYLFAVFTLGFFTVSCDEDDNPRNLPLNPDTAERASIDRFSSSSGTLMVRTSSNGLPEENQPIDYDSGEPFITQGFSPDGSVVQYYNFDVQTTTPAPIFLFIDSDGNSVEGQINVVNVIPGDVGYNDFWQVNMVTVPKKYVPNTITSMDDIISSGYLVETTTTIVNCPIVPEGSIALKRLGTESNELNRGWYKDKVVFYFSFFEKILEANNGMTPISPIFVSFNVNPDDNNANSGPASGFMTEMGTAQTHNVIASVPVDDFYSPLWSVNVYDNADFNNVNDLSSATSSNILASGIATVNCPVVFMQ